MTNAVTYSRFSTDRQNESSITDQVRICAEYAEREGMTIVEQYEDQGISGAALGNRPGALNLMEAALAGRFDALLVTDLSRLSRSNGDLSKMLDRLVYKGVRVVGVQDGYDSARPGHKLQAGLSGIIGESFRQMISDRTHAALESRAKDHRPTGGKCYGYRDHEIHEPEAAIVREIFERYADGASCRTIAIELNERGIPSPGSSWNRKVRRCRGWMNSAIRAMVRNERYKGLILWNRSTWRKDPDSGRRLRYPRPRSEWQSHQDDALRIIPDSLFEKAQSRTRGTSNGDARLKSGGKPRYLLSGLLHCGVCGAHYILGNRSSYACSGYMGGHCSNSTRVRRDRVEEVILDPIRKELLSPERVERMAREMQKLHAENVRAATGRANAAPQELQTLSERIDRLRERLATGDPDMEPDEIQAAIDRAEQKRSILLESQPAAKRTARLFAALPGAAESYRRQIALGLDNDQRAALKARVILRKLLGNIRFMPDEDGGLWAEYEIEPGALLRGVGTDGSGGPLLPRRVFVPH